MNFRPDIQLQWRCISVSILKGVRGSAIEPDCTAGGVTAMPLRHVYVTGPGVDGPYTVADIIEQHPEQDYLLLLLIRRSFGGRDHPVLYPAADPRFRDGGATRWWMNGGHFVYSCDSRFAALNHGYPIPVHDRTEGWAG